MILTRGLSYHILYVVTSVEDLPEPLSVPSLAKRHSRENEPEANERFHTQLCDEGTYGHTRDHLRKCSHECSGAERDVEVNIF